jgi:hypothetical protein
MCELDGRIFCFITVRVLCVNKWERVWRIGGVCVNSECGSVLWRVPKRRWMSVGLNLIKCQESLFLGTLIPILVPKSVVHRAIPQLQMRFPALLYSYNRAGKQLSPFVYRETLYSVIFIKIPAVMDVSSYSFVDKVEYFGAVCIPWRWRQQASPKCWCLFTELHVATCLKTGSSAQSSSGIWRQLFPVSWHTARRLLVAGQQTTLIR